MSTTPNGLVDLLQSIVLRNGRNVTEAAQRLRIGRPALSNVLNGNAELSLELAIRIEDVFQYSAAALLHYQVDQKIAEYRATTGSVILPVFGKSTLLSDLQIAIPMPLGAKPPRESL